MRDPDETKAEQVRVRRYASIIAVGWTAAVAVSLLWNLHQERQEALSVAISQAQAAYDKDVVYRRWNAEHGGVYVPVTPDTQPNPYLSHMPERDITTPSGRLLTLVNPAYMTRQVYELMMKQNGVRGHITSLKPIRPENAPDPWEIEALQTFERGEAEVSALREIDTEVYMWLMRPLVIEEGCLKCHAAQGYKLGDIRGGISVAVPMASLWNIGQGNIPALLLGHVVLWLFGLGGISFAGLHMNQRIQEREQAQAITREAERRYRNLFEQAPVMYVITRNEEGKPVIADCNKRFASTLGYSRAEILERPLADFYAPESVTRLLEDGYERALRGPFVSEERRLLTYDGRAIETQLHALPETDSMGRVIGTRAMYMDISERKRVERALRELNEELERRVVERTRELKERADENETLNQGMLAMLEDLREINLRYRETAQQLQQANAELEAFAYSVSHDLRAPLRAIDGFAQVLEEDYGSQLGTDGQHYLERVRAGSRRMGQLIDDLLTLSRLGRRELTRETLNLTALIQKIYELFAEERAGREIDFRVSDCPPVQADPSLMDVMLVNLLSNALKFTRDRTPAVIEFGCQTEDDQSVFFVRDNGVGFDMEYADKLFAPFQRLHRTEEYEGTGIGLAIVQRVIHRHGGDVWAEAEVDKGATFYFRL